LRLACVINSTRQYFKEGAIDQPHAKYPHGFAIVRIDLPVSGRNPEDSLAVVKVFSAELAAKEDAARLNKVNADKRCKYVVLVTHLILEE
jgi:hypothetical protein